jgi:hypothetical protein
MAALLSKRRIFAAKIEATAGTPESLAGSDAAENHFEPQFNPEIPGYEREGQISFSPIASVPGAQMARIAVVTHLYNSGSTTAPFWASRYLPCVGMELSGGIWKPKTGSSTTLTLGHLVDGDRYRIAGAQGNLRIAGDKVGEPVKMNWEWSGLYDVPAAQSLVTPSAFPTVKPPRFAGATLSLGSISPFIVRKFELNLGNNVVMREDASNNSGYIGSLITGRKPRITLTVEAPGLGNHNYFTDLLAANENAFSCAVGSGTNGIVTIAAPKLQLLSSPKLTDADGIFLYELEYQPNRNSAAGDDEVTITLI